MATPGIIQNSGAPYIGSVGHLIAAMLETAGLYFQSGVLEDFSAIFESLGVLFWVFAACGALYVFAVHGSYKKGLLLLLGPALFIASLQWTTETKGTALQFGERQQVGADQEHLDYLAKWVNPDMFTRPAVVSWVFAKYDYVVSNTVQRIVSVLVDTKNKQDLVYVARERVFEKLFTQKTLNRQFIELVSIGLIGQCSEYLRTSSEIAELNREVADINNSPNPGASAQRLITIQQKLTNLRAEFARQQLKKVGFSAEVADYVWSLNVNPNRNVFATCDEVWSYTATAAINEANLRMNDATQGQPNTSIPWNAVKRDVDAAIAGSNTAKVPEIVGAYILASTVQDSASDKLMGAVADHTPFHLLRFNTVYTWHVWKEGEGWMMAMSLFLGVIPYVQGVALFLLAGAFPFFCIMLVMPNKIGAIFTWMGMWAWVKSWDVGFAIIFFVRDILWQYLSRSAAPSPNSLDWSKPETIFQVVNYYDPMANMGTYYVILAVLYFAVPVISAQLFLGASHLAEGMKPALDENPRRVQRRWAKAEARRLAGLAEGIAIRREQEEGVRWMKHNEPRLRAGSTANGTKRTDAYDGNIARQLHSAYDMGIGSMKMDDTQLDYRGMQAMWAGRPISEIRQGQIGNPTLDMYLNTANEGLETRAFLEGVNGPLWSLVGGISTNNKNTDTAPRATGRSSNIAKDSEGGG